MKSRSKIKVVFIVSTGGSVIKRAFDDGFFAENDIQIVSDRKCGAISFAKENGIDSLVLESKTGSGFSRRLFDAFPKNNNELFVSFYTRLLTPIFLNAHPGRVINFHPSILPACPGQKGFEDTINSGSMFIGSTVHFIDEGIDTGKPLLQAAAPRNITLSVERLRHRVFLQQVISLVQIVRWFNNKSINYSSQNGVVSIAGAEYLVGEFSPNLDSDLRSLWDSILRDAS
ncbi:Phosphoribosylglycinamide formyltransferase [Pseudidiomarina piscicola]|uniref:phosphoribosylglycinamide formyltransferase 1 n=1 Tax=Pseudidiomarina piscicola TaxID=2614830 RepID=A0A6S6WRZ2_9GAMM|nr:formyltransferase family protein [Pseudidiomarina piscicola]CAB0151208.1 Phosphoribosylglycinamide formyltransferase [Pseudidiomarina piscicola]VZT40714.1 Phosphoribosylglycinamide formyltransferase [Pseudomonas aeruginosa]